MAERNQVRRAMDLAWTLFAARAAQLYIAGSERADALQVCRQLQAAKIGAAVCHWSGDGESPDRVASECRQTVTAIQREQLDCYLSLKAPALGFSKPLVSGIVEHAERANVPLHFDAQRWDAAERTFLLIREIAPMTTRLGCTLPGRWERSVRDARLAIDLGLRVRVVRGQSPDRQTPDLDSTKGFLKVVEELAGKAKYVAIATHDARLARTSLQILQSAKTPCELELLYGLPMQPAWKQASTLGVPVRIYAPYGEASLPYHYSDLRRDPRVLSWMLRDLFGKRGPLPPEPVAAKHAALKLA